MNFLELVFIVGGFIEVVYWVVEACLVIIFQNYTRKSKFTP